MGKQQCQGGQEYDERNKREQFNDPSLRDEICFKREQKLTENDTGSYKNTYHPINIQIMGAENIIANPIKYYKLLKIFGMYYAYGIQIRILSLSSLWE